MKSDELPPGIYRKHARGCEIRSTGECTCRPHYQAQAGPRRARLSRTFETLREAKRWRAQMELESRDPRGGAGRPWRAPTIRHSGERWLAAAAAGTALTRSGTSYRVSTLDGYRRELRAHVFPALGDRTLDSVTRGDVLELIGKLQREGRSPSTVRNVIVPLRALYRYAQDHEWTTRNPTRGVAMSGVSGAKRQRFAIPAEVLALLAALPERDRALWATAAYAGLRRGELIGLRRCDVDIDAGEIHVRQAYQQVAKAMGAPKTQTGARVVPISSALRPYLTAQVERSGALGAELVFARGTLSGGCRGPLLGFSASAVQVRAKRAWRAAGLDPIGLHDARHSFASSLLAAGVSMKVMSSLLGHSSVQVTIDIYSHVAPNGRRHAIEQLDDFLGVEGGHFEAPRLRVVPAAASVAG